MFSKSFTRQHKLVLRSFFAIAITLLALGVSALQGAHAQTSSAKVYPTTPFISPAAGTYTSGRTVTITDATAGSTIYYTTDGSAPTVHSPVYESAIVLPTSPLKKTIRAFAIRSGLYSSFTSSTFVIAPVLAPPSFSLPAGSYMTAQNVALTSGQAGATIHYTLDGTAPGASSPVYSGTPIHITQRTTIQAFVAAMGGYTQSGPVSQTYNIVPATPFISPAAGTYLTGRTVTLSETTAGAQIYYTTDGSVPTTASARYVSPLVIPTKQITETVRAFAVLNGVYSSSTSTTYKIVPQQTAPAPIISPGSGTYTTNKVVALSDTLAGATIYYTLDGSTPTSSSLLYTGPFTFPQTKLGTTVVKAAALMTGYLPSAVSQSTIVLTLPAGVIATAVTNSGFASTAIRTDFLGFSHDWGAAQSMMGQSSTSVNNIYRELVNTLSTNMGGPLVLRIGGGSTDESGTATAETVEPFAELAKASNVKFILGVNLGANNEQLAVQQASIFTSDIPATALSGIEIGNEPDGYSAKGIRASNYSYSNFLAEYKAWADGISTVSPWYVPIAGPVFGTTLWDLDAQTDLLSSSLHAAMITQHKYVACYYKSSPLATNILLQPASSQLSLWYFKPYVAAAHAMHVPFRIAEMNSICNGGQPGVSNSFSSALWAIDTMFEFANIGVDGVNWNTSADGGAYDLFHFATWKGDFILKSVNPLYYGLLLFSQAAGQNAKLLNTSTLASANVKVWMTTNSQGHAHLVIINKEPSVSGNVQITLPGYGSGSISRLTGSSYLATSGIAIAGQTYDGSVDGTLKLSPVIGRVFPSNDVWTIPVNAMSAVSVDLQP